MWVRLGGPSMMAPVISPPGVTVPVYALRGEQVATEQQKTAKVMGHQVQVSLQKLHHFYLMLRNS